MHLVIVEVLAWDGLVLVPVPALGLVLLIRSSTRRGGGGQGVPPPRGAMVDGVVNLSSMFEGSPAVMGHIQCQNVTPPPFSVLSLKVGGRLFSSNTFGT